MLTGLVGLLGLAGLLVVAAILLAVQRPAWYQPSEFPSSERQPGAQGDDQLTRDKQDFVNLLDQIGAALNAGRVATFRLNREQVNRWIAARSELPFFDLDTRPFEQVCIDVRKDGVWIAATVVVEGLPLVVAAGLSASFEHADVHLRLSGLRIGRLPVPAALLSRLIGRLPEPFRSLPHGDDLTWTARNRFIWENGKQPFRVEALEMLGSELRVTLAPLPRGF